MKERRKEKRYLYQTRVKYANSEEYEDFDAVSMNISADGINFISPADFKIGSVFSLKLALLDKKEPIVLDCEVIHRKKLDKGYSIGCKINDLHGMSRKEVKKILESIFRKIVF